MIPHLLHHPIHRVGSPLEGDGILVSINERVAGVGVAVAGLAETAGIHDRHSVGQVGWLTQHDPFALNAAAGPSAPYRRDVRVSGEDHRGLCEVKRLCGIVRGDDITSDGIGEGAVTEGEGTTGLQVGEGDQPLPALIGKERSVSLGRIAGPVVEPSQIHHPHCRAVVIAGDGDRVLPLDHDERLPRLRPIPDDVPEAPDLIVGSCRCIEHGRERIHVRVYIGNDERSHAIQLSREYTASESV